MSRSLGIDCGSKRVGLALSDELGITATPYSVVERQDAALAVQEIAQGADIGTIVIGLPTGLSGGEGASASDARNLGEELGRLTGVPVVYWDERFTSRIAEAALLESGMRRRDRRSRVDKVAAAIILQDYLDTQR